MLILVQIPHVIAVLFGVDEIVATNPLRLSRSLKPFIAGLWAYIKGLKVYVRIDIWVGNWKLKMEENNEEKLAH